MRIVIVTDAWRPQVNGVVRTITQTKAELQAMGHTVRLITPAMFRTVPCPTYREIRLSLGAGRAVGAMIDAESPDAIHIATEGPLGWAARRHCLARGLPFTTAYHTRFPEYIAARFGVPLAWTYALLRRFHAPASCVMVPTPSVKRDLEARGFANVALWSRGVDLSIFRPVGRDGLAGERPIFLYVGRVAVEKNVAAFLALDLPGTKWVVGEGPQLGDLKRRYPEVRYAGVLPQSELAKAYAAADVFVFPSKTDTFGLVLLEALACGTPIAAYPVTGPIDVIGDSDAGALDDDLRAACLKALSLPRERARAHAERFSWSAAAEEFARHLRPVRWP
ncbi:MAG TPA: glycosyltransferase family 1 protein [Alphaproteobacteria bacterium]|nr:glycosyltransferase family 1 protein [Alphaproteobacteria bacterium]